MKKISFLSLLISVITMSVNASEIITPFFTNSNSDVFHDQSSMFLWGTTTLSYYEYPANPEWGKKIVCTSSGYSGNAINLTWSIANSGGFGVNIFRTDWSSIDASTTNFLSFRVYSPIEISKNYLPHIKILSTDNTGGIEVVTADYYISSYLPAATWVEIQIPTTALFGSLSLVEKQQINDVQFFCIIDDGGVNHTLYIDDINFVTSILTTDSQLQLTPSSRIYYSNNIIHTPEKSMVTVYELSGKIVVRELSSNGFIKVNLQKGTYLVNTSGQNAKIIVQ